jgi:hypothetical protein
MFDLTTTEIAIFIFAVIGLLCVSTAAFMILWAAWLVRQQRKDIRDEQKRVLDSLDPAQRERRLEELIKDGQEYMDVLKALKPKAPKEEESK